jgi:ABC-type nitrate/sulfonate/bicarbonate transport system substrate-binding protein
MTHSAKRKKTRGKAIGRSVKTMLLFLFLAALLAMIVGCQKKEETEEGKIPVVAVGSQWYGHIPVWAGMERGTFEKHGFQVSWRFIGKSMDRLNAISSGDAQFASLGQVAMLSAMAQGNDRFYWVGNQDIAPGFEGLVAQPGITSFEELRGKTIGLPFGSSVDLTARMLLKEHGLNPQTDVRLVNLEVGDVPAVFRAGNVDAAIIWEPGFSQLKEVEGATVLGMDTDTPVYKEFGTMTGPDVLILGKAWCDENPDRARRFLRAYFESLEWVKENPDSAAEVVHDKYLVQDLDLIKKNLSRFVWQTLEDQKKVMSDEGIFGQTEYILKILHEDMKAIPAKPEFRKWVPVHILPFN